MGVSTLYLGDSKLADMQVSVWAKNELKNEKLKESIIKELYKGLLNIESKKKRTNRENKKNEK